MDRKTARAQAMKLIYEWEMGGDGGDETRIELLEIKPGENESDFMNALFEGVRANAPEIDEKLSQFVHGWSIERITRVDLAILRLATYELMYTRTPEGAVINEQQAKTVRYIFDEFLKGTALNDLSRQLQENGYKTGSGNDSWTKTGLTRILTNCKYAGDVVQGLTYTANILEKTRKRNRGDAPQYFMKDAIPAIIDRQTLLLAKGELMRREKAFHKEEVEGPVIYNRKNPFTHAVVCPDCGAFYNRKKSRDKYTLYCFNRINGSCKSPNIPESEMEQVVLEAAQKLHDKQPEIKMKKVPELKKNDEDDKLMRAAGLNTYNAFANRIVEFLKGKRPEKFDPEIWINLVEKIEVGETDYKVCFYGDQAVKVKHEAFKEDKRRLKRKQ